MASHPTVARTPPRDEHHHRRDRGEQGHRLRHGWRVRVEQARRQRRTTRDEIGRRRGCCRRDVAAGVEQQLEVEPERGGRDDPELVADDETARSRRSRRRRERSGRSVRSLAAWPPGRSGDRSRPFVPRRGAGADARLGGPCSAHPVAPRIRCRCPDERRRGRRLPAARSLPARRRRDRDRDLPDRRLPQRRRPSRTSMASAASTTTLYMTATQRWLDGGGFYEAVPAEPVRIRSRWVTSSTRPPDCCCSPRSRSCPPSCGGSIPLGITAAALLAAAPGAGRLAVHGAVPASGRRSWPGPWPAIP